MHKWQQNSLTTCDNWTSLCKNVININHEYDQEDLYLYLNGVLTVIVFYCANNYLIIKKYKFEP